MEIDSSGNQAESLRMMSYSLAEDRLTYVIIGNYDGAGVNPHFGIDIEA
jgi:hypothetical protein